MDKIKVYLDDERQTPKGWTRTYSVNQTITLLKTGLVTHLSLDHDLGACIDCGGSVALEKVDDEWVPVTEFIEFKSIPPELDLDLHSSTFPPDSDIPTIPITESISDTGTAIPTAPGLPHFEQYCRHIKNGYDVVLWIEEMVAREKFIPPQSIIVHSANSGARKKMELGITSIYRFHEINING